jgi:hypothetical protein
MAQSPAPPATYQRTPLSADEQTFGREEDPGLSGAGARTLLE